MRYLIFSLLFISCASQLSDVKTCGLSIEFSEIDQRPLLIEVTRITVNETNQTINIVCEISDSTLKVDSHLIGAHAMVKGRDMETDSDFDGVFHLYNLIASDTLLFRYVGYYNKEIQISEILKKGVTSQKIF
jgi:hypothetical protein